MIKPHPPPHPYPHSYPFSHVVCIPDGNRRWAQERGVTNVNAYNLCIARLCECFRRAFEMGFQYCTVWLISTKNLYERPNDEVIAVFDAIVRCIVRQSLCEWRTEERILINIIGEWREILHSRNISHVLRGNPVSPKRSREIIFDGNRVLTFLAGFDGPKETYQALRAIARHDSNITELPDLDLGIDGLPKPDLWIRTGDQTERLIKNEKSSYLAVPTYWPDMNANRFEHCVRTAVTLSSKRK